jgi:hypothetical protein
MTTGFPSILTVTEAAAAIVALINASPQSPRQAEIEAIVARAAVPLRTEQLSAAQVELQKAVDDCVAAEKALHQAGVRYLSEQDYQAAEARSAAAFDRMDKLADQLPTPPRSIADVVLRGWVAFCHADKDEHFGLEGLSPLNANHDQAPFAKLIADVLHLR